ncbi:MAG: diguanylate cyclase domain-containing protein [Prochlorococcaceae cyanobacterium]|jgi:diguanylate cyclase (GGDEF)-like protein/PAS domain S-box-containing protein
MIRRLRGTRFSLLAWPLLALGLLTAVVAPFLHLWYRTGVVRLELEAGGRLDRAVTSVQAIFEEVAGDTRLLVRLQEVQAAARDPVPATLGRLPPLFGVFLESYDRYLAIELLDARGQVLVEATRSIRPEDLRGGSHLGHTHPFLLRTAPHEGNDALTLSDHRWHRSPFAGSGSLPVLHLLRTLPQPWPRRVVRVDMRLDDLFFSLRNQVLRGGGEELVIHDARGRRLDRGGDVPVPPPQWSLRPTAESGSAGEGLVVHRSFDPLGRAMGSRERWTLSLWIPPSQLRQFDLLHQPVGQALLLTLYAGTAVAVTLLARAQRQRRRDSEQFAHVLDSLLDPHALLRPIRDHRSRIVDFQLVTLNQAAQRGIDGGDAALPTTLSRALPHLQDARLLAVYCDAIERGTAVKLDDVALQDPRLGVRHHEIRAVRVGEMLCLSWRDVSERLELQKRLADSEQQFRLLAENASDVVLRVGPERQVLWASPALDTMLGWPPSSWVGRSVDDLLLEAAAPGEVAAAANLTGVEQRRVRARSGQLHWIELHSSAVQRGSRRNEGWVMSFRTIDAEVALALDLERRACFDPLTGLLNRAELLERLQELVQGRRRGDGQVVLLFCDLDRFKEVNDAHGHLAGDAVLRAVADRLRSVVRSADLAGRMGGDELLVVLVGIRTQKDALAVAEKLRRALAEPIPWAGRDLQVSVSIGLTEMDPEESIDQALNRADQGMYQAKRSGRNGIVTL